MSDLKKGLIAKGFLEKDRSKFVLTNKATLYLAQISTNNSYIVTPVYLPIAGQVRAGTSKRDELQVNMRDLSEQDVTTIPIPILHNDAGAFTLEVVGRSMEHEGIFAGDYVIVQPYPDGRFPKQRELIVTFYLLPAHEDEAGGSDLNDDILEGPTLKYFTELSDRIRSYRLSWKREIDKSEYTIGTKFIKPVGRVVGIYARQLTCRTLI